MSHEAVPPHPDGDRWDGTRPGACSGERWTTPRELFSRDGGVLASTRVLLLHGWAPSLRVAGLSPVPPALDRKSTRLNSSHVKSSYAVFCLKKKNDNFSPRCL